MNTLHLKFPYATTLSVTISILLFLQSLAISNRYDLPGLNGRQV